MAARLLTADDLAARWQVPKSHVYRLTRERAIPAVRLGRYYRYRADAIEAFEMGDTEVYGPASVVERVVFGATPSPSLRAGGPSENGGPLPP